MMKYKLLATGLIVSAVWMLGIAIAVQPEDQEHTELLEQLRKEYRRPGQPDTSSDNWEQLSEDVGLMLFTDQYGTRRGTLYVRSAGLWQAIALQGPSELGPEVLPLGGQ